MRNKKKFKEFYEIINLVPYSRQEFQDSLEFLSIGSDVQKAAKFFIIAKMSFGGNFGGGWGYSKFAVGNNKSRDVNGWLNSIKFLPEISNRLKEVQIDNRDYKILMKYFDDPKIFIYADPPYLNTRSKFNTYDTWTEEEHKEFLDICLKSKCKIMISGYNSELYDDILNGWNKKTFIAALNLQKKVNEKKDTVEECIWMNYGRKEKSYKIKTLDDF